MPTKIQAPDWSLQQGHAQERQRIMRLLRLPKNQRPAEEQVTDKTVPCLHCPYRKDRPNWMDQIRTFFNVCLIRRRVAQDCHMCASQVCYGAVKCLQGGDDQIVSPHELATRPASHANLSNYNSE